MSNPENVSGATIHLPFLGQIAHAGEGISPDPKKVEAMLNATTPNCVTQLRTFIGQTGWLAKHVEGFFYAGRANESNREPIPEHM